MKKYNYENLNSDDHVFHMWEPLNFEIKYNYKFINNNLVYRIFSKIILIIVYFIVYIINKILFGYKIKNKRKLIVNEGVISVSNHIHPMDCTMIGIIYFPNNVYYPTIERNFKIPVIRHLIRILGAIPIPSKNELKPAFYKEINKSLENNNHIHMYPEGSMWPYYEKIRDFKYGAFKMAVNANKPIQPIKFVFKNPKGIYKLYKKNKCIESIILDPIYPNNELDYYERIEDLRNKTYESIIGG